LSSCNIYNSTLFNFISINCWPFQFHMKHYVKDVNNILKILHKYTTNTTTIKLLHIKDDLESTCKCHIQ
jgi:hypothetical protein